ncbi:MAG: peptidoglycan DD-metalloendopeptidase family protein [Polyangiales bacterium]
MFCTPDHGRERRTLAPAAALDKLGLRMPFLALAPPPCLADQSPAGGGAQLAALRLQETAARPAWGRHFVPASMPRLCQAALLYWMTCVALALPVRGAHAEWSHYRVKRGDTLWTVARRHGVSVATLRRINHIRGSLLRRGQRLRIPVSTLARRDKPAAQSAPSRRAAQPPPARRRRHRRVRDASEPPARAMGRREDAEVAAEPPARWPPPAHDLRLGEKRDAIALMFDEPKAAWMRAVAKLPWEGTFTPPVPGGRISRGWGSGWKHYHLALDIGAPTGTPVRAVEAGLVIYAGTELRGYGRIVFLLHQNGSSTAYAHNRRNLVRPGQFVQRGERIGTVGQSGWAYSPHLHFMLMWHGRHCDAFPLFRPAIPARKGVRQRPPARWLRRKPAAVACRTRGKQARRIPTRRRKRRRR